MATEQRHHGRIDVHRDCVELGARDWAQALLGHESLQCLDGVLVEAGEILVDGVDARDGASGEVLENWVWRQAFEVEYALRAGCSRIDQQLQLGVHGVDDPVPLLEPCKAPAQLAPDTLLLQECVEGDQASDTGQRAIVGPLPQAPRVRPADALLLFLPLVPRRPLASEPSSAHLLGARGAWYLLSHQPRRTGDSGAKFPLFAQFLTSQRLAPPTRWSEIQVQDFIAYRNINESFRLRIWNSHEMKGSSSLLIIDGSLWLSWLKEESGGVLEEFDVTHYAIYTNDDCLDVAAKAAPLVVCSIDDRIRQAPSG